MPTRTSRRLRRGSAKRGLAPGAAVYTGPARDWAGSLKLLHYDLDEVKTGGGLDDEELRRVLDPGHVSWVDLVGLHDVEQVRAVGKTFGLHPLWVEDLLNTGVRPKLEEHDGRLLVLVRMVRLVEGRVDYETVGLVAGPGWVLSFQERMGDVWDPIRARIEGNARIRRMGPAYLLHALLDALVDEYFLVVEHLDGLVDTLEDAAMSDGLQRDLPRRVHDLRGQVSAFRCAIWPLREAVAQLGRSDYVDADTQPFVRDLYDHVREVAEEIDTTRERLTGVLELHVAVTSHQLNVVMRVLTVVSTVFIPLTFLVGVYGMNFEHMPELRWRWGYPAVWAVMALMAAGQGLWFWRRGWFGSSNESSP
jgi:magnesium transporter